MRLLDRLTANPFITVKGAEKELGVAFTTAQRAIDVLVERKIARYPRRTGEAN